MWLNRETVEYQECFEFLLCFFWEGHYFRKASLCFSFRVATLIIPRNDFTSARLYQQRSNQGEFVSRLSSVRPSVFRFSISLNPLVDFFQISVVACSGPYAQTFLDFFGKMHFAIFHIFFFFSFSLTWDLLQNKLHSVRKPRVLRKRFDSQKVPGSVIP